MEEFRVAGIILFQRKIFDQDIPDLVISQNVHTLLDGNGHVLGKY
jgi:hypothetical protein